MFHIVKQRFVLQNHLLYIIIIYENNCKDILVLTMMKFETNIICMLTMGCLYFCLGCVEMVSY